MVPPAQNTNKTTLFSKMTSLSISPFLHLDNINQDYITHFVPDSSLTYSYAQGTFVKYHSKYHPVFIIFWKSNTAQVPSYLRDNVSRSTPDVGDQTKVESPESEAYESGTGQRYGTIYHL